MALQPFRIERYFSEHEFTIRFPLGSSDPESLSVGALLALEPGSVERLHSEWLGYTENAGGPALRALIASAIYETVGPADIVVHSGAQEAIFTTLNALLKPGDSVVVHSPCFQSHREIPRALGAGVIDWTGDPTDCWRISPEEIERLADRTTRAIVLNVPHNPTGFLFKSEELSNLIAIARRLGLWIISDETYRGSEHEAQDRLPAVCDIYEKGISIGALSKVHAVPGLRIGWAATKARAVRDAIITIKDYLSISNSGPSEFLALVALNQSENLIARTRARLRANVELVADFFARQDRRFVWHRPRAGTVSLFSFVDPQVSAEDFCRDVLRGAEVMLVPGPLLGASDAYVRIGYGRASLPECLAALESFLATGRPLPADEAS